MNSSTPSLPTQHTRSPSQINDSQSTEMLVSSPDGTTRTESPERFMTPVSHMTHNEEEMDVETEDDVLTTFHREAIPTPPGAPRIPVRQLTITAEDAATAEDTATDDPLNRQLVNAFDNVVTNNMGGFEDRFNGAIELPPLPATLGVIQLQQNNNVPILQLNQNNGLFARRHHDPVRQPPNIHIEGGGGSLLAPLPRREDDDAGAAVVSRDQRPRPPRQVGATNRRYEPTLPPMDEFFMGPSFTTRHPYGDDEDDENNNGSGIGQSQV
jgi:hypothetical protein